MSAGNAKLRNSLQKPVLGCERKRSWSWKEEGGLHHCYTEQDLRLLCHLQSAFHDGEHRLVAWQLHVLPSIHPWSGTCSFVSSLPIFSLSTRPTIWKLVLWNNPNYRIVSKSNFYRDPLVQQNRNLCSHYVRTSIRESIL